MNEIKSKPANAGIMPSGPTKGGKAGRPMGRKSPILCALKMEMDKLEACPTFQTIGTNDASRFFIGQAEIGGTMVGICEKRRNIRRNRIVLVPPFYGFLRLFTANGKKLRADGEVGGPREESSGPGTKPAIPLRQWSFIVKKFARG
jgi:hypothetical protein